MTRVKIRPILRCAGVLMLLCIAASCQSTGESASAPPVQPVKPIDQLRVGIVVAAEQLQATLALAEEAAAEPTSRQRPRPNRFADSLEKTRAAMQTLRADAQEVRDRAGDYMTMWSGEVVVVSPDGSLGSSVSPTQQRGKAKYDQMVTSLLQAREQLLPLEAELLKLKDGQETSAAAADLPQIRQRGAQAVAYMNAAVTQLDELKAILSAPKRP